MAYERQHRHDEQLQFAVFTRAFTVLHDIGWSRYSFGTGLAFLAWGGRGAGLDDWRVVAGAIALGWSWASPVAWRLRSAIESSGQLPSPPGGGRRAEDDEELRQPAEHQHHAPVQLRSVDGEAQRGEPGAQRG